LLTDEAVRGRAGAGAAVAGERAAEQAHLAERWDELAREGARRPVLADRRQDACVDEVAHGVADEALLVGVQLVEAIVIEAAERHVWRYTARMAAAATRALVAVAVLCLAASGAAAKGARRPTAQDAPRELGAAYRAYDAGDLDVAAAAIAKVD